MHFKAMVPYVVLGRTTVREVFAEKRRISTSSFSICTYTVRYGKLRVQKGSLKSGQWSKHKIVFFTAFW